MTKSEIKKILKQLDKDQDKYCENNSTSNCKKCNYNIKGIPCRRAYLLDWLAEHDEVIAKIKSSKDNKENKEDNNMKNKDNKKESKLKNKDIYKTPEERIKAFKKFCDSGFMGCAGCILDERRNAGNQYCIFYWLEMEHNPSDQIAVELVEQIKKSCQSNNNYNFVKELFSPKHREEIKAIWAKQDEEDNNEK